MGYAPNTMIVVCRMPQGGDCGNAEIAVPLHRRKITIKHEQIKKGTKSYENNDDDKPNVNANVLLLLWQHADDAQ